MRRRSFLKRLMVGTAGVATLGATSFEESIPQELARRMKDTLQGDLSGEEQQRRITYHLQELIKRYGDKSPVVAAYVCMLIRSDDPDVQANTVETEEMMRWGERQSELIRARRRTPEGKAWHADTELIIEQTNRYL